MRSNAGAVLWWVGYGLLLFAVMVLFDACMAYVILPLFTPQDALGQLITAWLLPTITIPLMAIFLGLNAGLTALVTKFTRLQAWHALGIVNAGMSIICVLVFVLTPLFNRYATNGDFYAILAAKLFAIEVLYLVGSRKLLRVTA